MFASKLRSFALQNVRFAMDFDRFALMQSICDNGTTDQSGTFILGIITGSIAQ